MPLHLVLHQLVLLEVEPKRVKVGRSYILMVESELAMNRVLLFLSKARP
jgi:hypothetical protein